MERKVLITGAAGYVGRHVCARARSSGWRVRALVRENTDRTPIGPHVEEFHVGDITDPDSLRGACESCGAVIHLVGIIHEGVASFERIHVEGTRNLLVEATRACTPRFIYLSGLGARHDSPARYHQTKSLAAEAVRISARESYIFPSSVIFGPEDAFFNQFLAMARSWVNPPWPLMPVPGGGHAYLQPVWVEDVAEILVRALEQPAPFPPGTYELGGPQSLTVREILEIACRTARRRRLLVPAPQFVIWPAAWLFEKVMRNPPVTRDQLLMLGEDGRPKQNRTEEWLGHAPRALDDYVRERWGT